jgi:hypothetical protein
LRHLAEFFVVCIVKLSESHALHAIHECRQYRSARQQQRIQRIRREREFRVPSFRLERVGRICFVG